MKNLISVVSTLFVLFHAVAAFALPPVYKEGATFVGPLILKEASTPTTPASNYEKIYTKSDGKLYFLNSSASELPVVAIAPGSPGQVLVMPQSGSTPAWGKYPSMVYTDVSGGSISTSAAKYTFGTKIYDSDNAYSSGTYTIPAAASGVYDIDATVTTVGVTLTTAQNVIPFVYKNGSQIGAQICAGNGGANIAYGCHVHVTWPFGAGDTIDIRPQSSVATTMNTAPGYTTLIIKKVSN